MQHYLAQFQNNGRVIGKELFLDGFATFPPPLYCSFIPKGPKLRCYQIADNLRMTPPKFLQFDKLI